MKNVRPYASRLFAAVLAASAAMPVVAMAENSATVGGLIFVNKGLVGIGRIPANQRDKFGETFGSGSGMAVDPAPGAATAPATTARSTCCPIAVTTPSAPSTTGRA